MNEAFVAAAKEGGGEAETEAEVEAEAPSVLHCVDDMSHACTTAHAVRDVAARLGIGSHLRLHEEDAYALAARWPRVSGSDAPLDLLWLDFGSGVAVRPNPNPNPNPDPDPDPDPDHRPSP